MLQVYVVGAVAILIVCGVVELHTPTTPRWVSLCWMVGIAVSWPLLAAVAGALFVLAAVAQ